MYKQTHIFQECMVVINENASNDYMVKDHWHEPVEILYVLEGEARQVIDGQVLTLLENDIIYIPPNMVHSTFAVSSKCRIAVALYNPQFLEKEHFLQVMHCSGESEYSAEFYYLFHRALQEYTYKNTDYIEVIKASLLCITTYLCRVSNSVSISPDRTSSVKDIFVYIENNLDKHLTVSTVAKHFGYTPEHFTKLIANYAGVSFKPYVDEARVTLAVRLLVFDGLSVNQTASRLGYDEVTSFYRVFKRVTGMSPTECVKQQKILENV